MALTQAGRNLIAALLQGTGGTVFNAANAYIGVGDGSTAFSDTQTDLQGTNKKRNGMDSSYPTLATNVITFEATFTSEDANFAWNEWGVFNGASGGVMLNRVVEYNGTKLEGQTWIMKVVITINIGS